MSARGPTCCSCTAGRSATATFRTLLPFLADQVTCHLIDLPGAGSSRFASDAPLSIANRIDSVRRVIDELGLDDVAVVGHDSGGLIARHAIAGDQRLHALGLIDTEQSTGLNWRFRSFIAGRRVPGFGTTLGWLAGQPKLRRNGFVLGDAFDDRNLLDGEFDEFFLQPLHTYRVVYATGQSDCCAASASISWEGWTRFPHQRIDAPVSLVWGEHDKVLPRFAWAKEMVGTFPDAKLTVIQGAGLFSHEERPAEVAAALLPTLTATPSTHRTRKTGSRGHCESAKYRPALTSL